MFMTSPGEVILFPVAIEGDLSVSYYKTLT